MPWLKSALKFSPAILLYGVALLLEKVRPLRAPTQPKTSRVLRNLSIGALGSLTLRLGLYSLLLRLAGVTVEEGWGLIPMLDPPPVLGTILAFLALDYTLYIWHFANHHVPFLWRFHNAHHVDLDLDISTGSRFHVGELILSVPVRAAEIVIFGIDPAAMILFDTVAVVAVHFHHSNVRLPKAMESLLNLIVVTPRMHGIHHSIVQRETNSNYSTVLSVWDRLHRSLRLGIPQSEVSIGVAAYRDPAELTFGKLLLLPFGRPRPWRLPDGSVPERPAVPSEGEKGMWKKTKS